MPEKTTGRCDRGTNEIASVFRRMRVAIRNGTRVAMAGALLAGFASVELVASEVTVAGGPSIQRSMRVVPRKFVITPSGPTVAANETQRFSVIDIEGKPVVVRWNLSGLGCYGASCGTIDEEGVYRPPASIPKPRVVTLEGVVVSDPRFSVLTQIRLEDGQKAAPGPVLAKAAEVPLPAPQVPEGTDISSRAQLVPVPSPVAATPTIGAGAGRPAETMPLPPVVGATPVVDGQRNTRTVKSPSLPSPVMATPVVENRNAGRNLDVPALPAAVAAAPSVDKARLDSRVESMQIPQAVSAAPQVDAGRNTTAELAIQPAIKTPAPQVEHKQTDIKTEASTLPPSKNAVPAATAAAAPKAPLAVPGADASKVEARKTNRPAAEELILEPSGSTARATVPQVQRLDTASRTELSSAPRIAAPATAQNARPAGSPPQPPAVTTVSSSSQIPPRKSDPMLLASKQSPGSSQTPPTTLTRKGGEESMADGAMRVTYRNGQLTIDVRNAPLADVLKSVAEKTGATIEIPPGTGLEHIVEHAGPGSPNDVLAQLLNGSHFNFIFVNSQQNPQELAQVLLSVQGSDTEATNVPPPAPKAPAPWEAKVQDNSTAAQTLPPVYNETLKAPEGDASPETRGEMMKAMFQKLNEKAQQNPH